MLKKFLLWLNSFFVAKQKGVYSSYMGSPTIRNYIDDLTVPVLLESARLDHLKTLNPTAYVEEIIAIIIKDIRMNYDLDYGYDYLIPNRLSEILQDSLVKETVVNTFKENRVFVKFVDGSDEIPLPFLKVYLLESN